MPDLDRPLIDVLSTPPTVWRPTAKLPLIASHGIREVYFNLETSGLKWFDGDHPIAASIDYPSDALGGFSTDYISWGHASGNTTDPATARLWMQTELRGVHLINTNIRFDIHHGREFGVDFEAMGCPVSDVGHMAALLDDHRQRSSLDALALEYFGSIDIPRLDESRMVSYPAEVAAPRAMYNVQLVRRLKEKMWPQLDAQDLQRVRALEDRLIYVVCEMEKNGTPIDLDLLKQWERRSKQQIDDLQQQISSLTGRHIAVDLFGGESGHLNPDSPKEMEALFKSLDLPIVRTATGRPSFSSAVLDQIHHPVIDLVKTLNRLIDLRAKYLVSDLHRIGSDGILRYALHQLRAVKDDSMNSGEAGTVTGRFSSTEITDGVGVNIQQRIKVAKQRIAWGYDEDDESHDDEIYLIRQLHIPASGQWLSADAMQIEYRLFANEVNSERINAAYAAAPSQDEKGNWITGPQTSFHRMMHGWMKPWRPDLPYRRCKDVNFAKIYAAGPKKIAFMLGFITAQQLDMLNETKAKNTHPLLKETNEILKIYDREIPEVGPLIRRASEIAKNRGYIMSILGRRQRFPPGYGREHKALNMRIQPSAADIMKTKLVELHDARKYTNFLLRFTVHDECDGDIPDEEHARRVKEVLDDQSFDLRIPILWEVNTGPNWAKVTEVKESGMESLHDKRYQISDARERNTGRGGRFL
jgi:DNA polymerase I-like protein with 3'-5' exonuclease and polymerase domains